MLRNCAPCALRTGCVIESAESVRSKSDVLTRLNTYRTACSLIMLVNLKLSTRSAFLYNSVAALDVVSTLYVYLLFIMIHVVHSMTPKQIYVTTQQEKQPRLIHCSKHA